MSLEPALTVGHGPHAVLGLHGWFGTGRSWRTVAPYLDGARYTYHFLDYRGYGTRKNEKGVYSVEEAAADAIAAADQLGLFSFSLLGHSMGGSIMQHVLVQAPDRVRSMVGVSPVPASGVPFDADGWALFDNAARDLGNRRAILDLTTGNRLTDVWLDAAVEYSKATSDVDAFAAYLPAWAQTDFHTEIDGHPVPVKVIVGEHDPALGEPVAQATFAQWYPNCEIDVLANAGHYSFDETPVALATSLERFLGGIR